jgi:hypothetical protein
MSGPRRTRSSPIVRALPSRASTADCGPVLFADPQARVVGAAHAGWKGAFTGVLESTVAAMESIGARRENIVAVLGPSISARNYEVGPEFVARFIEADDRERALLRIVGRERSRIVRPQSLHGRSPRTRRRERHAARPLHLCRRRPFLFLSPHDTSREADYGRQISAIVLEDI